MKKIISLIINLLILVSFFFPDWCQSQTNTDTCEDKIFHFITYKMKKNIEVVIDSANYKNYFVFKINLKKNEKNMLPVEVFFTEDLQYLFKTKNLYYFMPFNYYMYSDIIGFDKISSSAYERITNSGRDEKKPDDLIYFDRLDIQNNITSLFKNLHPWSATDKSENVFYIFKTSFDGILIKNDIKRTRKSKYYLKNIKVLIPFQRYLPLIPVSQNELENCSLVKRKPIKLCTDK